MITNAKFGNVDNVTIVEFGNGTLSITNGRGDGHKTIFIKEKEFSPIGESGPLLGDSDKFKPDIAIVFKNEESFNVFLEYVDKIKNEYIAERSHSQTVA